MRSWSWLGGGVGGCEVTHARNGMRVDRVGHIVECVECGWRDGRVVYSMAWYGTDVIHLQYESVGENERRSLSDSGLLLIKQRFYVQR